MRIIEPKKSLHTWKLIGFLGSRVTASLEAEVENLTVELDASSLVLEAAAKRRTVARRDILVKATASFF